MLIVTRLGFIACGYLVKGYYENRYIPAPEIAGQYNMNVRALMPALRQLTRVGILRSRIGGNTPGFMFVKNPEEYTMYQILTALEGDAHFECCKELVPSLKCDCNNQFRCGVYSLFNGLVETESERLSAISMADYAKKNVNI